MISRRQLLTSGAALAGVAAATPMSRLWAATQPPIIQLVAGTAQAALMDDRTQMTPLWAYGGSAPGPTLRAKRGDTLRIRLQNNLPQPTSVHWHGIRIDNAMDGVVGLTQAAVPPGEAFDYEFKVPDAGTYWYHPHHRTWEQMARGLYGMLIVEEDTPVPVDRELNFVADDWRLDKAGLIDEKSFGNLMDWSHQGRLGNWLTINGDPEPTIAVRAGERIRLRCANVANARILAFNFDREKIRASVIALDGQPTEPAELDARGLILAPAQRADLILDVAAAPGEQVPLLEVSRRQDVQVAKFAVSDAPPLRAKIIEEPVSLPKNPLPENLDLDAARTIPLIMEGGAMGSMREATYEGTVQDIRSLVQKGKIWAFNGIVGKPLKPLVRVTRNRTAIINMVNRTAWPHAMHLHGHHFRVVERNSQPVTGAPWRDTELVNRNEQVKIAFVADNPGKWLFHCHMLEHQAVGMLTWIEVA